MHTIRCCARIADLQVDNADTTIKKAIEAPPARPAERSYTWQPKCSHESGRNRLQLSHTHGRGHTRYLQPLIQTSRQPVSPDPIPAPLGERSRL